MLSHPFFLYTVARFAVFAAMAAVLYLLGFRAWALAFGAVLVSMPVSYVALRRLRGAFVHEVDRRRDERRRLRARIEDDHGDRPGDDGVSA